MRLKSVLLMLSLLTATLANANLPAQQNRKIEEVTPVKGDYAGKTFYTSSHAIIVGINKYQNLPQENWLQYAEKDARDMREILIRSYGFAPSRVKVLLNEQATKANIEAALSSLSNGDMVHSEDRALVFFAGHGQTVKLPSSGEMGFLIPYDAKVDLEKPDNRSGYLQTCIPMNSLWSYLEGSAAKHRLLIADACYGGLLAKMRALRGERPNQTLVNRLLARPAMQALTGGSAGETTQEAPSWGHGAFTYKLLEELKAFAANPDDVLSISELAATLKISVGNLTDGKQNPQFGSYGGTEGDFLFVATSPRPVPPLNGEDPITPIPKKKLKIQDPPIKQIPIPDPKPDRNEDPAPPKNDPNKIFVSLNLTKGAIRKYKVHLEYDYGFLKATADGTNVAIIKQLNSDGSFQEETYTENIVGMANGIKKTVKKTPSTYTKYAKNGKILSRTTDDNEPGEFSPEVLSLIDQLSSPVLSPFPMAVKEVWQTTLPNPMVEDSTYELSAYFDGYLKYRGLNCVKMGQTAQIPTGTEGKFVQFAIVFLLNPKTGQPEQVIAKAFKVPSTSNGVKFDVNISATIQYLP